MNCFDVENQSSSFFDGEMSGEVRDMMISHLSQCEQCAARLAEFKDISEAVRRLPTPAVPASIWTGISDALDNRPPRLPNHQIAQQSRRRATASSILDARKWLTLVAAVFVLFGFGFWVSRYVTDSHAEQLHSAEFVAAMDHYLTTLPADPEGAEKFLLNKYDGQTVDSEGAVKLVGYRPAVADGLPEGYSLASTSVLKMPCCTCVKTVCKRQDGSTLVLFEHDDEKTEWFGDRQSNMEMCGDKACCLVDLDSSIAATWKRGSRSLTAVGVRDVEEVNTLVSWLDKG